MSTACVLKRCQGKRGCICPKGNVPVGAYAGRKLDPISGSAAAPQLLSSPKKSAAGIQRSRVEAQKSASNSSPKKLDPIVKQGSDTNNKTSLVPTNGNVKSGATTKTEISETVGPTGTTTGGVEESSDYSDFNGEVMIRYNHYKKKFPVEKGITNSTVIDAEYYLSFAFPNCKIHVSIYGPSDFSFEDQGYSTRPIMKENPEGTYHGLDPSKEYWVEIEEDQSERQAYEARQDERAAAAAKQRAEDEASGLGADMMIVKGKTESCSCIEGNPCLDRYACKNWEKRYEIAKANGWKGFQ